ncbi:hypothetical protein [Streptomyces sp. S063]|uniref:hypothetical protein n=1 Tax=Streptomyces sp. S063 TaxID=2005885 RepID=UPI0030014D98
MTLALSRLAAQHDEITRLREQAENAGNVRRLPASRNGTAPFGRAVETDSAPVSAPPANMMTNVLKQQQQEATMARIWVPTQPVGGDSQEIILPM